MPQVPYSNSQVSDQSLPGPRANPDLPIEAFGGGTVISQPAEALYRATNTGMDIQEKSYKAANDAAIMNKKNEVDRYYTDGLYGTKDEQGNYVPGLIQKIQGAGEAGPAVQDEFMNEYDKRTSDMMQDLTNDVQRESISNYITDTRRDIFKTSSIHLFTEQKNYEKRVNDSALNNAVNKGVASYNIPGIRDQSLQDIKDQATSYGFLHGQSDEQIQKEVSRRQAKLYEGVVKRYIDNGRVDLAKLYYTNDIEKNISDREIQPRIEKMINVGVTDDNTTKMAYKISTQFDNAYAMRRSVNESTTIPEDQKDAVARKAEHLILLKNKTTQVAKDDVTEQAANIAATQGYEAIPIAIKATLSNNEKADLQNITQNSDGSKPIETDTSAKIKYDAMNIDQLHSMTTKDKFAARLKLNNQDYSDLMNRVKLANQGVGGNQEALAKSNEAYIHPIVLKSLQDARVAGITPKDNEKTVRMNPDKAAAYDSASKEINQRIKDQFLRTGKTVTEEDKRKIANSVANAKVYVEEPGKIWGTNEKDKLAYQLTDAEKKTFRVRIKDITDDQKSRLYEIGKDRLRPNLTTWQDAAKKYPDRFERAAAAAYRGAPDSKIRAIMGGEGEAK